MTSVVTFLEFNSDLSAFLFSVSHWCASSPIKSHLCKQPHTRPLAEPLCFHGLLPTDSSSSLMVSSILPGSYNFSTSSSAVFPGPSDVGVDRDIPFRAEYSKVFCSVLIIWLWVSICSYLLQEEYLEAG